MNQSLLDIHDLSVSYTARSRWHRSGGLAEPYALRDVSLAVAEGQTTAVVGESGSGKTTIARAVAGLLAPTAGDIAFRGQEMTASVEKRSPDIRRRIQYVFQNPDASLNPRRRVRGLIARPLRHFFGTTGDETRRQVHRLLETVHLDPALGDRYPGQLSGGERQRVAIAQALAAEPDLVLCDEICSALDVSVQAEILGLLRELQAERGLSYLFISHDLAVVRHLAQSVVVLYAGEVMESGTAAEVFAAPYHPYTRLLLESIPQQSAALPASLTLEQGDAAPADRALASAGCPFVGRCPNRIPHLCESVTPPAVHASPTSLMRCHAIETELSQAGAAPTTPAGIPSTTCRRDR